MIHATPSVPDELATRLAELDRLRLRLGEGTTTFNPWLGTLRRSVRASTVESSVSIEGYTVSDEEALALIDSQNPPAPGDDDQMAFVGYARAMDHVGVMATDPTFSWSTRVILDLHFDACSFQRDRNPGRWRTEPVLVTERGGGVAYRGPAADEVPALMTEVAEWLDHGDLHAHPVVRGAMAHLHVVSVHPFSDGNGRVARIAQSLVLAREGLVSPELGSIEEYLAEHTRDYYGELRAAQGGIYQPDRDASGWVSFCVDAHLAQAEQRLSTIEEAAARWQTLEQLAERSGWPDRLVVAMELSLAGGADSASYRREVEVSPPTASADFRRLLDAGLAEQRGRGRSTRYEASADLRRITAELG